jgi:hypothetical protein
MAAQSPLTRVVLKLRIADPQPAERREWRRSIAASQGHAKVPSGMRITHQGRDHGDLIIRLSVVEPLPEPETRPPLIPVIERLTRPHPLIAATRSGASSARDGWVDRMRTKGVLHMRVASQSVRRVLLITQSLILEAERRGYGVEVGSEDRRCAGGLCITIDGHPFELTFAEENDRHPHVATKTELDRAERYSWQKVPEWDYTPSGRLQLRSGHDGYKPLATDRVRWRLDDRLGHALAELEARAGEFTRRAMEEQRRLEQRQLAWEQAMERARIRLVESHRADHLRRQVDDRRHASEIRALVAAARDAAGATWAIDPKTEEWLTWASDHADEIDPLRAPMHMLDPPEATSSALQPFLDGWSPYGPDRRGW